MFESYVDSSVKVSKEAPICWLTCNFHNKGGNNTYAGHAYLFLEYVEARDVIQDIVEYKTVKSKWYNVASWFRRDEDNEEVIETTKQVIVQRDIHVIERIDFPGRQVLHLKSDSPFSDINETAKYKRLFTLTNNQIKKLQQIVELAKKTKLRYSRMGYDPENNIYNCTSSLVTLLRRVDIKADTFFSSTFKIYSPANIVMDWDTYFKMSPEGQLCSKYLKYGGFFALAASPIAALAIANICSAEQTASPVPGL